jgi:lactose/L-arabinose transport system ATP-binding protein
MVYVTHDQVEAMTLADKIVVLRDGRIEQQGTPINLYDDPDNVFVAGFIGSPRMNLLAATITAHDGQHATISVDAFPGSSVRVKLRGGAATGGAKATFGVRPEHFVEAKADTPVLTATARVVEQLGGVSYVYATGTDGVQVTVQEKGHSAVPAGAEVRIGLDPDTCLLFDADGKRL